MQAIEQSIQSYIQSIVLDLGKKHGFCGETEMREILGGVCVSSMPVMVKEKEVKEKVVKEVKEKVVKVVKEKVVKEEKEVKEVKEVKGEKVVFPFSGKKNEGFCEYIKKNHGLFSQCMNRPEGVGVVCKTCSKKEPEYGMIQDRIEGGVEWKDPKGVGPTHFRKIMRYLKHTEEEVRKEASEQGIFIDEVHFEELEIKKGRVAGKKVGKVEVEEDKKRGRPKKEEVKTESEDLFATLIKEAADSKVECVESKVVEKVVELEEGELEEVEEVKKFKHGGVSYLRSSNGVMYDIKTEEAIGVWNEEDKCIDLYEEEEEEEEEEE